MIFQYSLLLVCAVIPCAVIFLLSPLTLAVGEEETKSLVVLPCVPVPIRITTRPKKVQAVRKGEKVDLTVVAVSDRLFPVSYRWILRSKLYEGDQAPPHVLYNVSSGLAYINTTNFTDEEMVSLRGVYRREVFHRVQKVVVNVEVRVGPEYDRNDNGEYRNEDAE